MPKTVKKRIRKPKPLGPQVSKGQPSKERTARRRALVADLWCEGYRYSEIVEELKVVLGEAWTRQTIAKDVEFNRKQWEKESGRSPESHREELIRMTREIFRTSMRTKKVVTRREMNKDGKLLITSALVPAPDLSNANKAVERMGALRGLNVTTLDGSLTMSGLADMFGDVADEIDD